MVSPEKVNFNNTDFIDIVPVVKPIKTFALSENSESDGRPVKAEVVENIEVEECDHIVIDSLEPELQDEGEYNEEEVDDVEQMDVEKQEVEEESRVVKLEPRVRNLDTGFQVATFQDAKSLQADGLKDIKHKTRCKVCKAEFQNRQVEI